MERNSQARSKFPVMASCLRSQHARSMQMTVLHSRCWRRMNRKDIPAEDPSSLEAFSIVRQCGMMSDKTSDKIANR